MTGTETASATALVSLSNRSAWATVARALKLEELVRSSERALFATALEELTKGSR